MKNQTYIMIGSPIITREIFRKTLKPLDNYSFKPEGGFWASKHINNFGYISDWFQYLIDADSIARYKDLNHSTIFTLKDDAKILTIDSAKTVLELAKKYPSYHHILGYYKEMDNSTTIFDFEKLAEDFDGVYINYDAFFYSLDTKVFNDFSSNSLLLFNLDCIKEYRSASIIFDIDNPYFLPRIIQEEISEPKQVEDESYEHKTLSSKTETLFLEMASKYHTYTFNSYDEYLTIMTQNVSKIMFLILEEDRKKIEEISKYLSSEQVHKSNELIAQNIALNYLSKYLTQDEGRIKKLPKSKIKSLRTYHI